MTCPSLTGIYERDEGEAIVVSVHHSCQRPACVARRWRIVRLPAAMRPTDGARLVAFAPGDVVR